MTPQKRAWDALCDPTVSVDEACVMFVKAYSGTHPFIRNCILAMTAGVREVTQWEKERAERRGRRERRTA